MEKLNCILVDDDSFSRKILKKCIENVSYLNLVGEFSSAIEASKIFGKSKVDLIFLDIEMPLMDGFAFINTLSELPLIIFVAGKGEYALKAFDYNATDYVTKPIEPERFNKACDKALKEFKNKIAEGIENKNEVNSIFVKSGSKLINLALNEILYVEALGDYVNIYLTDKRYTVLSTMKSLHEKLEEYHFLRVHKSYIINIDKIQEFQNNDIFIGGIKIPVSRNFKKILKDKLSS